ncbi:hypothetical protein ACQ4PT_050218 [Festuca glaucescens]
MFLARAGAVTIPSLALSLPLRKERAATPSRQAAFTPPPDPAPACLPGRRLLPSSTVLLRVARPTAGAAPRCSRPPGSGNDEDRSLSLGREKANAGHLTNFEVLDFLRTRGAKTDPMGCLGAVAASECKVYEFLLKTPACNQTKESVSEFAKRCEGFKLTHAEKQNIINWRPSSVPDVFSMVEECEKRFSRDEHGVICKPDERVKEILNLIDEVLPPAPTEPEDEAPGESEGGSPARQE